MNTTPTASPELPDLGALSNEELIEIGQRVRGIEASDRGGYFLPITFGREVERAVLARRAQPEGEAPQADWIDALVLDVAELPDRDSPEQWPDAMLVTGDELRTLIALHAPAATLSPLCGAQQNAELVVARLEQIVEGCDNASERAEEALVCMRAVPGAQHAESGASDLDAFGTWKSYPLPDLNSDGHFDKDWLHREFVAFKAGRRAALAVQQAAAPGALDAAFDALESYGENGDYVLASDVYDAFVKGAAPSAPGTPEAPKDERKGIELWRATLRACGELPEGYEVRIELENGCGMAVWYDAEGERHVIDGDGYLSDDVNEAVDAAIQRAAALKGGS